MPQAGARDPQGRVPLTDPPAQPRWRERRADGERPDVRNAARADYARSFAEDERRIRERWSSYDERLLERWASYGESVPRERRSATVERPSGDRRAPTADRRLSARSFADEGRRSSARPFADEERQSRPRPFADEARAPRERSTSREARPPRSPGATSAVVDPAPRGRRSSAVVDPAPRGRRSSAVADPAPRSRVSSVVDPAPHGRRGSLAALDPDDRWYAYDSFEDVVAPGAVPGRRTITITGRGDDRPGTSPTSTRRAAGALHERVGFRPDRFAMWAVLLGIVLAIVAATSSHAAMNSHAATNPHAATLPARVVVAHSSPRGADVSRLSAPPTSPR